MMRASAALPRLVLLLLLSLPLSVVRANEQLAASGIPFKATSAADDMLVYRAVGAFVLAAAAAFGLAWSIKRFMPALHGRAPRAKELERLELLRLSARSALVRVRWGNEELLLGEGEHGVAVLARRGCRDVAAGTNSGDGHEAA